MRPLGCGFAHRERTPLVPESRHRHPASRWHAPLRTRSSRFAREHLCRGPSLSPALLVRHWTRPGWRLSCNVRAKLFPLDDYLFVRRLGTLAPQDCDAVRRRLAAILLTGTT